MPSLSLTPEIILKKTSLIRLTYLNTLSLQYIRGKIGNIPQALHADLLKRIADFLHPAIKNKTT